MALGGKGLIDMQSLINLWNAVNNKYGAWAAGVVILAILGAAYYLGYTPSQVIGWIGK